VKTFRNLIALGIITSFVFGTTTAFCGEYVLPEKTEILLRLITPLTSGKNKVGEVIELQVEKSIRSKDGTTLIEDNADAFGTITVSKKNRAFGKTGKLGFTIDYVEASNGTRVPVRATIENNAVSSDDEAGAGFLFVSEFSGFLRKENLSIPSGTIFKAYVDRDTNILILKEGEHDSTIHTPNLNGQAIMDNGALYLDLNGTRFTFGAHDLTELRGLFAKGLMRFDEVESDKSNIANQFLGNVGDNFKIYFWSMDNASNVFLNVKTGMGEIRMNKDDALGVFNALSGLR